jgi:hypothetical protein
MSQFALSEFQAFVGIREIEEDGEAGDDTSRTGGTEVGWTRRGEEDTVERGHRDKGGKPANVQWDPLEQWTEPKTTQSKLLSLSLMLETAWKKEERDLLKKRLPGIRLGHVAETYGGLTTEQKEGLVGTHGDMAKVPWQKLTQDALQMYASIAKLEDPLLHPLFEWEGIHIRNASSSIKAVFKSWMGQTWKEETEGMARREEEELAEMNRDERRRVGDMEDKEVARDLLECARIHLSVEVEALREFLLTQWPTDLPMGDMGRTAVDPVKGLRHRMEDRGLENAGTWVKLVQQAVAHVLKDRSQRRKLTEEIELHRLIELRQGKEKVREEVKIKEKEIEEGERKRKQRQTEEDEKDEAKKRKGGAEKKIEEDMQKKKKEEIKPEKPSKKRRREREETEVSSEESESESEEEDKETTPKKQKMSKKDKGKKKDDKDGEFYSPGRLKGGYHLKKVTTGCDQIRCVTISGLRGIGVTNILRALRDLFGKHDADATTAAAASTRTGTLTVHVDGEEWEKRLSGRSRIELELDGNLVIAQEAAKTQAYRQGGAATGSADRYRQHGAPAHTAYIEAKGFAVKGPPLHLLLNPLAPYTPASPYLSWWGAGNEIRRLEEGGDERRWAWDGREA